MATALLLDHEELFRAVEGTLLRRESGRLLKATADRLLPVAKAERPDVILTLVEDEPGRQQALGLCADRAIASTAVIVLEPGRSVRGDAFSRALERASSGRRGAVALIRRDPRSRGAAGTNFDERIDEALRHAIPALDRASDRVAAEVKVRCEGRGLSMTLRTKNLSPSGLFLKTPRPLTRGRRFQVQFRPFVDEPAVTALCEVVRLVPARGTGKTVAARRGPDVSPSTEWSDEDLIPGVGVRFLEIDEAGRAVLNRFVNRGSLGPEGGTHSPRRRITS